MHIFVGNFTYISGLMIVEDISSIIEPRLLQVVLGKPFAEISNMTHDLSSGVVRQDYNSTLKSLKKSRTVAGDGVTNQNENPIHTLRDYSRPSHEGYRNTIELPDGNNVVPLRSDTIRLVQNGSLFHELRSEDPNQHLKDFLKLVDSLDLDVANKERTRLTSELRNDILMFQQHQGKSLSEAWTHLKDLLQKVPHHGIDLWPQVQIFYDHVNLTTRRTIDQLASVSQSLDDESKEARNDISDDVNSEDESDDITNDLHNNSETKEDIQDNIKIPSKEKDNNQTLENNMATQQALNECNSNDLSRPPGYENCKKDTPSSSNCSTSFARFQKKDIKGFYLIKEMTRIIEVGDSLGYDVRGCRKSLKKMINGIGQWKNLGGNYFMINLYGHQYLSNKDVLWRRIEDFMHQNNGAFVLFEDFNELPMGNRSFTWMNKSGSKLSKLDHFLLSANAIEALPNSHVTALDKLWSNHNPILLHCNKVDYAPTPFSHKEATLIALKNIEVKSVTNSATDEDRDSRIKLLHEIDKLDRLEYLDLQQKSRINWDIKGDENFKLFHGIINQRRQTKTIHGIIRDGSWTTDLNLVKDTFLNFFKEKFKLYDFSSTFPSTSFLNLTVDVIPY
uniref:RNA-directed DNA polymerase, eukaryota n=1 Tax=Tanacetum cinerariifolium TaxID=118510 RepID=A0A6L2K8N4_TANCI|nr:hypothetical protein [Tanacetum cinerariifolium]